jgi:hypothetical protein
LADVQLPNFTTSLNETKSKGKPLSFHDHSGFDQQHLFVAQLSDMMSYSNGWKTWLEMLLKFA